MGDWIDEEKNVCQAISDSRRDDEKKSFFFEISNLLHPSIDSSLSLPCPTLMMNENKNSQPKFNFRRMFIASDTVSNLI